MRIAYVGNEAGGGNGRVNWNSTFTRTPRRPMRKVSEKRELENKTYAVLRRKFLEKHPRCQFKKCSARSFDVHHTAGRGGSNFLDVKTWKAVCRSHHDAIHSSPNEARKQGLLS